MKIVNKEPINKLTLNKKIDSEILKSAIFTAKQIANGLEQAIDNESTVKKAIRLNYHNIKQNVGYYLLSDEECLLTDKVLATTWKHSKPYVEYSLQRYPNLLTTISCTTAYLNEHSDHENAKEEVLVQMFNSQMKQDNKYGILRNINVNNLEK